MRRNKQPRAEETDERFSRRGWADESEENLEVNKQIAEDMTEQNTAQIPKGAPSRRLAIVNLDWDSIDASSIYQIISGFSKPEEILGVKLYKTPFGKSQLEKEAKEGPLVSSRAENRDQEIRKYIKNRMKYFYAVVEFASAEIAEVVYEAIDGLEIGETHNFIDARFLPEGAQIKDEIEDEATKPSKISKRIPKNPLYHTKAELRWDEDAVREEYLKDLFTKENVDLEIADELVDASDDEEKKSQYRKALLDSLYDAEGSEVDESGVDGDEMHESVNGDAEGSGVDRSETDNDDIDNDDMDKSVNGDRYLDKSSRDKKDAGSGYPENRNAGGKRVKPHPGEPKQPLAGRAKRSRVEDEIVQEEDDLEDLDELEEESVEIAPGDERFAKEKNNPDFSVDVMHPSVISKKNLKKRKHS